MSDLREELIDVIADAVPMREAYMADAADAVLAYLTERGVLVPNEYPDRLETITLRRRDDGSWACGTHWRGSLHEYYFFGPTLAAVIADALRDKK